MFRMIRCGSEYCLVIVVSPPDAEINTPGVKFYRFATWQIGEDEPLVFNEISPHMALCYFSWIADGLGFEAPPQELFASLEDATKYAQKRNSEHRLNWIKEMGIDPGELV